jgi:hypothetical protein
LKIQGVEKECRFSDRHFINWDENKEHKKLRPVISKMSFNIRLSLMKNCISKLVSLPSNTFLHLRSPKAAQNLPPDVAVR